MITSGFDFPRNYGVGLFFKNSFSSGSGFTDCSFFLKSHQCSPFRIFPESKKVTEVYCLHWHGIYVRVSCCDRIKERNISAAPAFWIYSPDRARSSKAAKQRGRERWEASALIAFPTLAISTRTHAAARGSLLTPQAGQRDICRVPIRIHSIRRKAGPRGRGMFTAYPLPRSTPERFPFLLFAPKGKKRFPDRNRIWISRESVPVSVLFPNPSFDQGISRFFPWQSDWSVPACSLHSQLRLCCLAGDLKLAALVFWN